MMRKAGYRGEHRVFGWHLFPLELDDGHCTSDGGNGDAFEVSLEHVVSTRDFGKSIRVRDRSRMTQPPRHNTVLLPGSKLEGYVASPSQDMIRPMIILDI